MQPIIYVLPRPGININTEWNTDSYVTNEVTMLLLYSHHFIIDCTMEKLVMLFIWIIVYKFIIILYLSAYISIVESVTEPQNNANLTNMC